MHSLSKYLVKEILRPWFKDITVGHVLKSYDLLSFHYKEHHTISCFGTDLNMSYFKLFAQMTKAVVFLDRTVSLHGSTR